MADQDERYGALTHDVLRQLERALRGLQFGSVEMILHDGKVVQIERKEKVRIEQDNPRRKEARE